MLDQAKEKSLSKLMTKILRHKPEDFGVVLDDDGSCTVGSLLAAIQAQSRWASITLADVEQVVCNSDKQRFALRRGVFELDTVTVNLRRNIRQVNLPRFCIMVQTRWHCRRS